MARRPFTVTSGPFEGQLYALDLTDGEEITFRDSSGVAHVYAAHVFKDECSLYYIGVDPFG